MSGDALLPSEEDLVEALELAKGEVVHRLRSEELRAEIPSHTIVRMIEVLGKEVTRQQRDDGKNPPKADEEREPTSPDFSGLPPDRAAALRGETSDPDASVLPMNASVQEEE